MNQATTEASARMRLRSGPGRIRRTTILALAVALTGGIVLSGCDFDGAYDLPLPGSPVSDEDSFQVTAEFADVLNVVPRSPVMVDDVVVGEVTEVERVGWHAKVTLRVKDDVVLPDNAIADIQQVSLLGEKYVSLEEPTEQAPEGRLADGDNIGLAVTGRNPEVEEVLGALSFLLSGGGVAQLGTITEEANKVMSGRTDRLRSLLGSLEGLVGTLDDQKADIIHALESLNSLTSTLNAEKDTIGDALDATGPAIDALADQHDELIGMLTSLDKLGRVGTRVLNASKEDVLKILAHLEPVLNGLAGAGDELAPGLNLLVSFPFPKAANSIVQGDYADTTAIFELNFPNLLEGLGIPNIQLPDLGEVVDQVAKCLKSGKLTGRACAAVLSSVDLLADLKEQCKKPNLKKSPVCTILNAVPDLDLDSLLEDGLLGDTLNGLLGGTNGLARSMQDPSADPTVTTTGLLGGAA